MLHLDLPPQDLQSNKNSLYTNLTMKIVKTDVLPELF